MAVQHTVDVIEAARKQDIPVIFTRVVYHPTGIDGGLWVKKIPVLRSLVDGSASSELADELKPLDTEALKQAIRQRILWDIALIH